jgi:hypothetical protein
MKSVPVPRIVEAERLENGVIITFEDGKHALYPASLLYATLPRAEATNELESDEKED